MEVKEGVDRKRLDQSGWGIIFANDADPVIQEALAPLLNLRASQAGERFRLYEGAAGHRLDQSKSDWLAQPPRKVGPGPADPDKVPYYLLICGSPERIPYRFQSQLDVQYAVGRIHFDTLDEYANYAHSVVEAETGPVKLPRHVRFFGVANPMDHATNLSAKHLITPLRKQLGGEFRDWTFCSAMAEEATKARLATMLGGGETPALLFTASHGMDFPVDSSRQLPHQGALLCQDWPGPGSHRGPIPQDFYFAGDDLDANANLLGLIAFFFACYGAGTPEMDDFARQAFKERSRIAPRPFLAGTQTEVFRSTFHRLLEGHPVGSALEYFNDRYAELSTVLSDTLDDIDNGKQSDPYDLAGLWTANNDARGYALIGDPAVSLPVAKPEESEEQRQPLEVRTRTTTAQPAAQGTPPAAAPEPPAIEDAEGHDTDRSFASAADAPDTYSISTYTLDESASPPAKTLVARTRVLVNGDIENLVDERFADHDALLALHRGTVERAIADLHAG